MKTALITGGLGFIGTHIAMHLLKQKKVKISSSAMPVRWGPGNEPHFPNVWGALRDLEHVPASHDHPHSFPDGAGELRSETNR